MTSQIDALTAPAAASKPASNGNGIWPEASAVKQYFCLPDNIIYYIAKNPSSPEGYLKLAMSCKYFFEMKSLLVVARIHHCEKFCSNKYGIVCMRMKGKCCVNINLAKLTCKIWLTHRYYFRDIPTFIELLSQKLYKCDSAELYCSYHTIVFENFKLIALPFEKCGMVGTRMVDKDGNVHLEEILGSFANVKEFYYVFRGDTPAATALTMKNIYNLKNLGNLRTFHMKEIPEVFAVKDFEDFIMKHKDTKIELSFLYDISKKYKGQLNGLREAAIAAKVSDCAIKYCG